MRGTTSGRVIAALAALALAGFAHGCGGDDGDTEPTEPALNVEGCPAIAATCVKQQRGCVGATETRAARCEPCAAGQHPTGEAAQCTPIPGTALSHTFPKVQLAGGEEVNGLCQSWVLNNESELWVNAVEFSNDGWFHHSNWFFVPMDTNYPADELWYDCYDGGFSEVDAAIKGGVLYAQSTQVTRELQKFPSGAAVRVPPYSRIIAATHMLNYSPKAEETEIRLTFYTVPADEVAIKLAPFRLGYGDLHIPPKSVSEFTGECDVDAQFQQLVKKPMDFKLYYALPHYHALGTGFRLEVYGGAADASSIFELKGYGEPGGHMFDPPVDLSGAKGLRFTCVYDNPRDEVVKYGIGDQEMCVMLGFAESTLAFDASVNLNETVETRADGVVTNTGACKTLAFPFAQNKDGGTP